MRTFGLLSLVGCPALAEPCIPPPRPFVPRDQKVVAEFVTILRHDFELYFRDIQNYFRCLDEERARAFEEAREVSEEYGRFLGSLHR
ncbi:hypothetical protein CUR85_17365 [Sulfitobacter faviae]|nr:hypothetical protein [Sulfitobacter faviae]MDH4541664.1 hypothetical protein [Sulfitobacter faviae]